MKNLYLDVCTICRPFDQQEIMRIRLETDAVFLILQKIQDGQYNAIRSIVHTVEVSAISNSLERQEILALLDKFDINYISNTSTLRKRADKLHNLGFGLGDAAHLAYAESTSDAFITCDDKLLKRSMKEDILIPTYNPIEFVIKEELR